MLVRRIPIMFTLRNHDANTSYRSGLTNNYSLRIRRFNGIALSILTHLLKSLLLLRRRDVCIKIQLP